MEEKEEGEGEEAEQGKAVGGGEEEDGWCLKEIFFL